MLECSPEELAETARSLIECAIPLRTEDGYWLEDDDVFTFFLREEEADTLKDFQKILREKHPQLKRRLSEILLLRAAADDLLRNRGGRANWQSAHQLDELLEKAVEEGFSLIIRYEDESGEDVKELHIDNILRTEDTAVILAEDLSGTPVRIRMREIVEAYRPVEKMKCQIELLMSAEALAKITPYLEEEATITPRGRDVLLVSRVHDPEEFFHFVRKYDPQAQILTGGNYHADADA